MTAFRPGPSAYFLSYKTTVHLQGSLAVLSNSSLFFQSIFSKINMKFTSALLFASAVTAAQLDHHRREPGTKPRALTRRSQPRISTKGPTNSTKAQYSQNWAGAVIVTTGVTAVTGTITVPSVSAGHSGGATKSCASAWIGIDGATCVSAILQMGVDFCFENGQASYSAWYEWYPGKQDFCLRGLLIVTFLY